MTRVAHGRMEAIAGATANLEAMVQRVLGMVIEADSLLMGRWFSFPGCSPGILFFACCAEYADLTLLRFAAAKTRAASEHAKLQSKRRLI